MVQFVQSRTFSNIYRNTLMVFTKKVFLFSQSEIMKHRNMAENENRRLNRDFVHRYLDLRWFNLFKVELYQKFIKISGLFFEEKHSFLANLKLWRKETWPKMKMGRGAELEHCTFISRPKMVKFVQNRNFSKVDQNI